MNQTIKYISLRILTLALIVLGSGLFYEIYVYPDVIKQEGWIAEIYDAQIKEDPTVLFFSASPNKSCADSDNDKRSISQMTSSYIGETIHSIDAGAFHAGVFLEVIKKLPDTTKVHTVVMDLNIRSFGIRWIHSPLENSIQKSMAHWNGNPGIINRLNISLKNFDYTSQNERLSLIEYSDKFSPIKVGEKVRTVYDWTKEKNDEKSVHFLQKFAFNINENNIRVSQYDEVVKACKRKNLNLILVILPEDVGSMGNQIGQELKDIIHSNAKFLYERYSKGEVKVLNLSSYLDHDRFYEEFPTEHYDQIGRDSIAKSISQQILN